MSQGEPFEGDNPGAVLVWNQTRVVKSVVLLQLKLLGGVITVETQPKSNI